MKGKIDFEWDDEHVVPEVVNPDLQFLFRRMIEATHQKVNPGRGQKILDIGCGRGTDGVEVAKTGAVVIGLDPSRVMMAYARDLVAECRVDMAVIHGLGECLPLRDHSLDKVMCKGALDHFADPAVVIRQIAAVLKPGGEAIISIANFESLGFKLGKGVCRVRKLLGVEDGEQRMPWDIPHDHTYKLDYSSLRSVAGEHLEVKQATGVSLLFGLPWWGTFLARCPGCISLGILNVLDKIARHVPSLSDVVVLRCGPRGV